MPDPDARRRPSPQSGDSRLRGTALRSAQAGLVAVFLMSFAFATFGPWFNLALGYGLMIAAMVAALLGMGLADQAAHEAHRNPALTNGIYAKSGAALSIVAFLVSVYYTGLFVVLLVSWPMWLIFGLILYAVHRGSVNAAIEREVRG